MADITNEQAYDENYDDFMAVPPDKVTHANLPTEVATADARRLATAAAQDRDALLSVDVPAALLDSILSRAMAYTQSVVLYETAIKGDPSAVARWKELSARGYELQKYFDKFMTRAYRNEPEYSKKMDEIRQGRGHRDMIMDIGEYTTIAENNPEPLRRMTAFDYSTVAEGKELFRNMQEAYSKASIDPQMVDATKDIMNRAYTWYKKAADEIKAGGQFLFDGTDRYNNYISEYHRNIGKKAARTAATETETDATEESQAV